MTILLARMMTVLTFAVRGRYLALCMAAMMIGLSIAPPGLAQTGRYPAGPVRLIVPFPPGGVADFLGRNLATELSSVLGSPVIVENRPGASSNIGSEYVAASKADGHTLLLAASNLVANVSLYKDFKLDPTRDFSPIVAVATTPNILVVHPDVQARSVRQLVELLKAKPDTLTYATSGAGSPAHLAAEQFQLITGVTMVHVSYKGAGPAMIDLLAGRVSLSFSNIAAVLGHIRSGKLIAVALTGAERSPALPQVPTMAEAGIPGFEHDAWYGILAPRGTPMEVIEKLNAAVVKLIAQPAFKEKLLANGAYPVAGTSEEFAATIAADIPRYADLIRRAKIPMN